MPLDQVVLEALVANQGLPPAVNILFFWQKCITSIIPFALFYIKVFFGTICKTRGIYLEKHVQIQILIVHQQMALMLHSHPNRNIDRPGIFYISLAGNNSPSFASNNLIGVSVLSA